MRRMLGFFVFMNVGSMLGNWILFMWSKDNVLNGVVAIFSAYVLVFIHDETRFMEFCSYQQALQETARTELD